MKIGFSLVVLVALSVVGCNKSDATKAAALEQRISVLETQVGQLAETVERLSHDQDLQAQAKKEELLGRINEQERLGNITPAKADELRAVLDRKTPLYRRPDGTYTTNKFE